MSADRLTTPNPITARHGDQLAPTRAERLCLTSAGPCTRVLLPMLSLTPVFTRRQREDQGIEDGQGDEAGGRVQSDPVQLVTDEETEESDHPGIGPELVEEQRDDQQDLDRAVRQQVDGTEAHRTAGEAVGTVENSCGDQIVRVLRQLPLGQDYGEVPDSIGASPEKEQAAEEFCRAVEALADDADLKEPVQPIAGSEHVDRSPGVLGLRIRVAERDIHMFGVHIEPLLTDLAPRRP